MAKVLAKGKTVFRCYRFTTLKVNQFHVFEKTKRPQALNVLPSKNNVFQGTELEQYGTILAQVPTC